VAIEKVTKVLVAVHAARRDRFLVQLQRSGLLHITKTETGEAVGTAQSADVGRARSRLVEAIELLKTRAEKKAKARPVLSRAEFDRIAQSYDAESKVELLNRLRKELAELDNRAKTLAAEVARLRPWQRLRYAPQELSEMKSATVILGRFADQAERVRAEEALAHLPVAVEPVGQEDGQVLVLIAADPAVWEKVTAVLSEMRFEAVDLRNVSSRPAELLAGFEKEQRQLDARRSELGREIDALTAELVELQVAADALAHEQQRQQTLAGVACTDTVLLIHGWVRSRELGRLERLVEETGYAALVRVEPDPGEEPPVALVNRPVFRPFEMGLELFSMPSPKELDPTWLIAPFFGTFFALCLTDAGYGIVVALLTYLLLRRLGSTNKLLGIVLIGGLLTIPAGALVGGWFGDMPDRLGLGWLLAFKNRLMWFDPVKEPMKFFILSLGLGYLQMICGIAFEIADCLRVKNYGEGLLGQLPWFVGLNSLVVRVVFGRALPQTVNTILLVLVLGSMAAIIVFTQRDQRTMLAQWTLFGLLTAVLLYFGGRFRWLPAQFLEAKWAVLVLLTGMTLWAWVSVVRQHRVRPSRIPAVFGVLAVAGLVLSFSHILPAALAGILATLFFLLAPSGSALLSKLAWGGYALYGATGYIGVVLSYIRLMALGMCTGGVAVAINVIAWMVLKMPVVGIPLALVILVVGHSYNIAVNVLGAFVHSLRLQYVEFFPRFYTGGGERFAPFQEQNEFVLVK